MATKPGLKNEVGYSCCCERSEKGRKKAILPPIIKEAPHNKKRAKNVAQGIDEKGINQEESYGSDERDLKKRFIELT